jgi:DNA-binding protein HU-beta
MSEYPNYKQEVFFMTKQELVNYVADQGGLTKKDAEAAVSNFTDAIKGALKKGDSVSLVGFGTFSVSKRKARQGRNPQTGATINIPAKKVPVFKAGKALKDAVN